MHEVLVNRLGGLSLPRKSVVRLTDSPDMTLDVYHGCKTTIQHPDPSYKTDLEFWDCLRREKTPYYNRRNTVCGKTCQLTALD